MLLHKEMYEHYMRMFEAALALGMEEVANDFDDKEFSHYQKMFEIEGD